MRLRWGSLSDPRASGCPVLLADEAVVLLWAPWASLALGSLSVH